MNHAYININMESVSSIPEAANITSCTLYDSKSKHIKNKRIRVTSKTYTKSKSNVENAYLLNTAKKYKLF